MVWIAIIFSVICFVLFFVFLKKKQNELEKSFQKKFSGRTIRCIDKTALYVARESDGLSHFRGIGYLVLTDNELHFERQLKSKIINIPISSIISVEKAERLAGQSPGPLMLKVVFMDQSGKKDAIAWKVRELEEWISKLSEVVKNGK